MEALTEGLDNRRHAAQSDEHTVQVGAIDVLEIADEAEYDASDGVRYADGREQVVGVLGPYVQLGGLVDHVNVGHVEAQAREEVGDDKQNEHRIGEQISVDALADKVRIAAVDHVVATVVRLVRVLERAARRLNAALVATTSSTSSSSSSSSGAHLATGHLSCAAATTTAQLVCLKRGRGGRRGHDGLGLQLFVEHDRYVLQASHLSEYVERRVVHRAARALSSQPRLIMVLTMTMRLMVVVVVVCRLLVVAMCRVGLFRLMRLSARDRRIHVLWLLLMLLLFVRMLVLVLVLQLDGAARLLEHRQRPGHVVKWRETLVDRYFDGRDRVVVVVGVVAVVVVVVVEQVMVRHGEHCVVLVALGDRFGAERAGEVEGVLVVVAAAGTARAGVVVATAGAAVVVEREALVVEEDGRLGEDAETLLLLLLLLLVLFGASPLLLEHLGGLDGHRPHEHAAHAYVEHQR